MKHYLEIALVVIVVYVVLVNTGLDTMLKFKK